MKLKIFDKYKKFTEQNNLKQFTQIISYLEDDSERDLEEDRLDIIFPGNDIYNFTNRLSDFDIGPLASAFKLGVKLIRDINLQYNLIGDKGAQLLTTILEDSENIVNVNLMGNQISDHGAKKLAEALKEKIFLYSLNLNTNLISDEGLKSLNELLYTNPGIMKLDIGCNRYSWHGIIALTTALKTINSTLQVLNIDEPCYQSPDQDFFTHFGKMFLSNKGLQRISMRGHQLRFEGVSILTDHLLANNTLRVLDLTGNQICFQGIAFISEFLKKTKTLISLILASNRTHNAGAKILAQGIAANESLIHLDVTNNGIKDEGLCRLAEGLSENKSIRSLKIFLHNTFGYDSLMMFNDLLLIKDDYYTDFQIYEDQTGEIQICHIDDVIPNYLDFTVS